MKVWVYVEGQSEEKGLSALWSKWMQELKKKGWGIRIIPLDNKDKYFRKIGARATEKLTNNTQDIVVGLPDLGRLRRLLRQNWVRMCIFYSNLLYSLNP